MQIGFIGAGFMGYGIAHNLSKSGHMLRVIVHLNRHSDNILLSQLLVPEND